jgi:PhoH-like ATPase
MINQISVKNNYFILDTSALLFDPNSLTYFKDNYVYIPVSVIQELDKHKDRLDNVGQNARQVNRKLHDLKKLGKLSGGVKDPESGVSIKLVPDGQDNIPDSLDKTQPDNRILGACFALINKNKKLKNKVHLVTNDLNLGLKAEAFGINNFEFQPDTVYKSTNYIGHREVEEAEDLVINEIYKKDKYPCPDRLKAINNEFFLIKNPVTKQSVRCIYREKFLYKLSKEIKCYDLKPLNNEQFYALNLLLDPEIKLVTLTGIAGSGKTLLSMAAGLFQCIEKDHLYEKLIVSRSLVLLSGKDKLGFLKGGLDDKLRPYVLPLRDSLEQVLGDDSGGNSSWEYLTGTGTPIGNKPIKPKIEIEPLQFIRGRSLRNAYFICDESQNLSLGEVKAIVSRMGENSKIIMLGDIQQVDNPYLSKSTNGLTQVIEKFKGSCIAGHITLVEGVRSALSAEAAERL